MNILLGGFFLLFGAVWTAIVWPIMHSKGIPFPPDFKQFQYIFEGVGYVFLALGALLLVRGLFQRRAKQKLAAEILQRGKSAKGTVTFADKNYSLLVNNTPIYSIVEFTFQDAYGKSFTSRKPNIESELVIRNKIEVGSTVDVMYLPEDPSRNALLIRDPSVPLPTAK